MADSSPYEPLPGPGSVRFLHAQRDNNGRIQCLLKPFCLYSPACPHYNTLSYVWGSDELCESPASVSINGHPRSVLPSVIPILEAICDNEYFGECFWFWIDSICINQEDTKERGSQVQLMSDLYQKSTHTIVWLGERSETSDQGIDFLHTLNEYRDTVKDWVRGNGRGIPDGVSVLQDGEKWKAAAEVLMRPWFTRVWTLQEFVLSGDVDFYCGKHKMIQRKHLHPAIFAIWNCFPRRYIPDSSWLSAWRRRRLYQWWRSVPDQGLDERMPLASLMAFTGDYQCTNPVDRIFSMLGMTSGVDRRIVGEPSYEMSIEEVYIKFARSFIDMKQNLDIICFAHIFRRTTSSLPTWVPDWRCFFSPMTAPLMVSQSTFRHIGNFRPVNRMATTPLDGLVAYEASGKEMATCSFSHDGLKLLCRGYILDRIDGIGVVMANKPGQPQPQEPVVVDGTESQLATLTLEGTPHDDSAELVQSTSKANLPVADEEKLATAPQDESLNELLMELTRTVVLDRGDMYLQVPVDPAFRVEFLRAAHQCEKGHENGTLHKFNQWLDDNKGLLVRGRTVQSILSHAVRSCKETLDQEGSSLWGEDFIMRHRAVLKDMKRRLATTEGGDLGTMPESARKGDIIAVLVGCSVPVVLRRTEGQEETFQFVGEAYVHGWMNGEILEQKTRQRTEFVIG